MFLKYIVCCFVLLYCFGASYSAPSCLGPNDLPLNAGSVEPQSKDAQTCICPNQLSGVFWREWDGRSPHDVIIGGKFVTDCGQKVPLLLGQAYHQHRAHAGIQPAQLLNNTILLTPTYQVVYQVKKNIKVLCGDQESVAWVPWTEASKLNPLTDFVRAGYEPRYYVYFGRGFDNGKRVIGKVVVKDQALYFPYWGHPRRRTVTIKSFDVLCHRKSVIAANITIPSNQLD